MEKKKIRRKVENTIKENREDKENHASRKKEEQRKQSILASKEIDALKLFQAWKGTSESGISFAIA